MKAKYLFFLFWSMLFLMACTDGYEKIDSNLWVKRYLTTDSTVWLNESDFLLLDVLVHDNKGLPFEKGANLFNPKFVYLSPVSLESYSYDFLRDAPNLHTGDSLVYKTLADSFFIHYYGIDPPKELQGTFVFLHVKVKDIIDEESYYSRLNEAQGNIRNKAYEDFEKYLSENKIEPKVIGTGTIKVTTKEGKGESPYLGDIVSFHMIQKKLNGEVLENSYETGTPFEYKIGDEYGLKGMDEALMKMKKGEKANIYLPFFLAFGEEGVPPRIPPFTNIMMELELLDYRKPVY